MVSKIAVVLGFAILMAPGVMAGAQADEEVEIDGNEISASANLEGLTVQALLEAQVDGEVQLDGKEISASVDLDRLTSQTNGGSCDDVNTVSEVLCCANPNQYCAPACDDFGYMEPLRSLLCDSQH